MKYFGKAEQVAQKIVDAFKGGNLPKALAPIFVRRKDGVPCRAWSFGNQLLCILSGTLDARGIKQWNSVRRTVKKGSKCFEILVPLMKTITVKDPDTQEERKARVLYGFGTAPVFPVECTECAELPTMDQDVMQWLNSLPLIEVARAWGLDVDAFNGLNGSAKGNMCANQRSSLQNGFYFRSRQQCPKSCMIHSAGLLRSNFQFLDDAYWKTGACPKSTLSFRALSVQLLVALIVAPLFALHDWKSAYVID